MVLLTIYPLLVIELRHIVNWCAPQYLLPPCYRSEAVSEMVLLTVYPLLVIELRHIVNWCAPHYIPPPCYRTEADSEMGVQTICQLEEDGSVILSTSTLKQVKSNAKCSEKCQDITISKITKPTCAWGPIFSMCFFKMFLHCLLLGILIKLFN